MDATPSATSATPTNVPVNPNIQKFLALLNERPQEERIENIKKNGICVLKETENVKKRPFVQHCTWITEGSGWCQFIKLSKLGGCCVTAGTLTAFITERVVSYFPKTHACQEHCPPESSEVVKKAEGSSWPFLLFSSIASMNPQIVRGVSATAGAIGGAYVWKFFTESREDFQEWENQRCFEIVRDFISNEYKEHPKLSDFQCPLSKTTIKLPMKWPTTGTDEIIIDKSSLKTITIVAGSFICPFTRQLIAEKDIKINYECAIKIGKTIRVLMREDSRCVIRNQSDEESPTTFWSLIDWQSKWIDDLYKKAANELISSGESKSFEEEHKIRAKLMKDLGTPSQDLPEKPKKSD